MPHPFAFLLAKGWDTTSLNQPVHQERCGVERSAIAFRSSRRLIMAFCPDWRVANGSLSTTGGDQAQFEDAIEDRLTRCSPLHCQVPEARHRGTHARSANSRSPRDEPRQVPCVRADRHAPRPSPVSGYRPAQFVDRLRAWPP